MSIDVVWFLFEIKSCLRAIYCLSVIGSKRLGYKCNIPRGLPKFTELDFALVFNDKPADKLTRSPRLNLKFPGIFGSHMPYKVM